MKSKEAKEAAKVHAGTAVQMKKKLISQKIQLYNAIGNNTAIHGIMPAVIIQQYME